MPKRTITRQNLARLVWTTMQDLVLAEDRTEELRDALNLGRGSGRVKLLVSLTDGPHSLSELAEVTGADAPYTSLIVNELEARGLVTRSQDPTNRRRKLVALTSAGERATASARDILARPPERLDGLSLQELELLSDLLRTLADR